jgi:diguanylate cyclase (GGDEF)-like protein
MLAVACFNLLYAVELLQSDLEQTLQIICIEYLIMPYIPSMLLLFVLRFTSEKETHWQITALVLLIPFITTFIFWTQEHHKLFYINPYMDTGGFFPVIAFERGPWYYVYMSYQMTCTGISAALLLRYALTVRGKKRNQTLTVMTASLFPILGAVLYMTGAIPGKLDTTPISLVLTGLVTSYALFMMDLLELVPAARELALDSIREAFLVINRHGLLMDLNHAARQLPGAAVLKIGEPLPEGTPLVDSLRPLLEGKSTEGEFSTCDSETDCCYYKARAYPLLIRKPRIDGTAILVTDITETTGLMKQLGHHANTDALTGIFNRRQITALGTQEMEKSRRNRQPLGVIMVDLDHFKKVNDVHGHAAGDEVLKAAVRRFQKVLRSEDILGRYGGEEFAVFIPAADAETTLQVAERLRKELDNHSIPVGEQELSITASLGVYSGLVTQESSTDGFLKKADEALYRAKAAGRNRVESFEA